MAHPSLYPAVPRQESRTALGSGDPAPSGVRVWQVCPKVGQVEQSCAQPASLCAQCACDPAQPERAVSPHNWGPALSSHKHRPQASHPWHPFLSPVSVLLQGTFPQAPLTDMSNPLGADNLLPKIHHDASRTFGMLKANPRALLPLMRSP